MAPFDPTAAGRKLKQCREAQGWTRTDLAREAGVSAAAIANYERGSRTDGAAFNPHLKTLTKVAGAFPGQQHREILSAFGFERQAQAVTNGKNAGRKAGRRQSERGTRDYTRDEFIAQFTRLSPDAVITVDAKAFEGAITVLEEKPFSLR